MTAPIPEGTVRSELSGEKQPEPAESKPQSGVDKVRAERQRRLEAEPGYKSGEAIGKHLRKSSLIVLPLEMALAPVLLALGGWWLDDRLGTSPLLVIVGLALGLVTAVMAILRTIKEVNR